MNSMSDLQMETVRIIVLLCVVLALLALIALNVFYPLPIDFYAVLLWLVLGLALLCMGLRSLHLAHQRREYLPWHREPDILLCTGAFFATALSLLFHSLSHENVYIDMVLLFVFGVPTLILAAYSLRLESLPMQQRKMQQRKNSRSTV